MTADPRPEVGAEALAAFLTTRFDGPIAGLAPLTPGEIARVFAFEAEGRPWVVRLAHDPGGFEKDRLAHQRWAAPGLPIPWVREVGQLDDLWYAISERLPGRVMWDIPRAEYDLAMPALLDVHDRVAAIEHDEGPPWREWLASLADDTQPGFLHGWRSLFDTSFLERDRWEGLHRRFAELLPRCPDERRVVHGDFGLNNVLIDGPRVTGVLDWANCRSGDPLYDVAYLTFWGPRDAPVMRARYGHLPDYDTRIACYHLYGALGSLIFYARTDQPRAYAWIVERLATL
jgi:hygromycin-B 4-O-kinase